MVLTEFLTETRKRWLKAFKVFKRNNTKRSSNRNKISPADTSLPYSGTIDASSEIQIQRFCGCKVVPTPLYTEIGKIDRFESFSSRNSVRSEHTNDSAYDSARSSPEHSRNSKSFCYATVTYFNVNDSEDSSSIKTEFTVLDYDEENELNFLNENESAQNLINESIELVSSL